MRPCCLLLPSLLAALAGCGGGSGYGSLEMFYGVRKGDRRAVRISGTTLYSGPDFRSARTIRRLRRDEQVDALEDPVNVNGSQVVKVELVSSRRVGWMRVSAIARYSVRRKREPRTAAVSGPSSGAEGARPPEGLRSVKSEGVVLKERPSLSARSLGAVEKGAVLRVTGPVVESGGVRWVPVEEVNVKQKRRGYLPPGALD